MPTGENLSVMDSERLIDAFPHQFCRWTGTHSGGKIAIADTEVLQRHKSVVVRWTASQVGAGAARSIHRAHEQGHRDQAGSSAQLHHVGTVSLRRIVPNGSCQSPALVEPRLYSSWPNSQRHPPRRERSHTMTQYFVYPSRGHAASNISFHSVRRHRQAVLIGLVIYLDVSKN